MKNIKSLIALAALPFCSNEMSFGQDAYAPPPAPGAPPTVPAPTRVLPPRQLPPPGAGSFSDRLNRIIRRASAPEAQPQLLIIRSSPMSPKEQASLHEDLAVMAHILDKALEEGPGTHGMQPMGIDVFGGPNGDSPRSVYLEGYGALFTMNAGFPLVAPPPRPENQKEQTATDSTWEEAKRELHGQAPMPPVAGAMPGQPVIEEYSADKVTKVKDAVLQALKNATNIRGLKPEDWLTVCVLGGGAAPGRGGQAVGYGGGVGGYGSGGYGGFIGSSNVAAPGMTVMTIRVKRADVDAFAKGQINAEEFGKKAQVETYTEGGAAGTGAGSAGGGGMGGQTGGGAF